MERTAKNTATRPFTAAGAKAGELDARVSRSLSARGRLAQRSSASRGNEGLATVLSDLRRVAHTLELTAVGQKARIIGFTSAVPGEGVSTCIAAISYLLASEGSTPLGRGQTGSLPMQGQPLGADNVVLVDANIGDPSLNQAFGMPMQPGLTEAISSPEPLSFARRAENASLFVIPAGHRGRSALDPDRLRVTLQEIANHARLVLVDLPSVLHSPEGVKLAGVCDALVMVVRANSTRWEAVAEARRLLERAGVPLLGAVLNRRRFELPRWLYERL